MQYSFVKAVSGFTHCSPLGQIKSWFKRPSIQRLHKFRSDEIDSACIFEADDSEPESFLMTAQRSGVKLGDCIGIEQYSAANEHVIYKIQKIDYYCPSELGMWVARLVKAEY